MNITTSPWGRVDTQRTIAPGIIFVSTPSHGGYWLSPARVEQFKRTLPDFKPFAGFPWLEEDCDAALAALVWPDELDRYVLECAIRQVVSKYTREHNPELVRWLTESEQGRRCLALVSEAATAAPAPAMPQKPAAQQALGLTFDGEFSFNHPDPDPVF